MGFAMPLSDNKTFEYLPVPEIVTRLGLYVTGAGTAVVAPGANYPPQQHPELYDFSWRSGRVLPEFQFIFISEGGGQFESLETGMLEVVAGTVIQIFPDVWHRYRPDPSSGWTEYWISVGGELMFQWQQRGLLRIDSPLSVLRHPAETLRQYQRMIKVVRDRPRQIATQLTATAMAVIAMTLEQSESATEEASIRDLNSRSDVRQKDVNETIRNARRVIWNHSHRRVSVDMVAKLTGTTRRTLERHFQEQLGRTVLQELIACRIQRAKRLLAETRVPIKYVAFAAGFSSVSNLCKVFRRELDLTPGEFRESCSTNSTGKSAMQAAGR